MYTPVFASKRKNPRVYAYVHNARKGVQKIEISQKGGCEKSVHLFSAMGVKNVYTSFFQLYINVAKHTPALGCTKTFQKKSQTAADIEVSAIFPKNSSLRFCTSSQ